MEKKTENPIKIKICVGTYCYVMGGHELRELKNQTSSTVGAKSNRGSVRLSGL